MDTIDRLVRILDEERTNARDYRRHTADQQMLKNHELNDAKDAQRWAERKVDEWVAYADALLKRIPESKRKGLPKEPGPLEAPIPF